MNQIVLENVKFRYPNGFLANENLNLTISQNERVANCWTEWCRKNNSRKLMNGLNKPTEGNVLCK